jgi:hypothetical protein
MSDTRALLLPLIALLGAAVACPTEVEYGVRRGILEYFGYPADVTVPDTVPVNTPASIVVTTYTGGCNFAKAFEEVSVEGLLAVVEPYDSVNVRATVCRAILRIFGHTVELRFGQQGTATVRVVGLRVSEDGGTETVMTVERTIVVN